MVELSVLPRVADRFATSCSASVMVSTSVDDCSPLPDRKPLMKASPTLPSPVKSSVMASLWE